MLNRFFDINMPYGLAKNEEGEWMVFNREYVPIGFNTTSNREYLQTGYENLPIHTAYKGLNEKLLTQLAHSKAGIQRNNKGEIEKVFLYNDETNPKFQTGINQNSWELYFDKIKILSKLERKPKLVSSQFFK